MNAYNAYAGKNEALNRDLTDFFCYVCPCFDRHCIASTVFVPKHFANCTKGADSAGLIYRGDLGRQMREDKQCPFSGETKGSGHTVQFGGRLPESEAWIVSGCVQLCGHGPNLTIACSTGLLLFEPFPIS